MAAEESSPVVIQIDGQDYTLNDLPSDDSKLVVAEKEKILSFGVDVNTLANNLSSMESLVRRISEAVEAAGPKFIESQLTIQHLKPEATALYTKSALTILRMNEITSTILTDLKLVNIYGAVVDHHDEGSVSKTLTVVSGAAKDMEKVVSELQHEFEQAVEIAERALRQTEVVIGQEKVQGSSDQGMDNLHQVIRVLKELSVTMMQAGHFWKQVGDHCKYLTDEGLKRIIQKAVANYPEEKRCKVWTSTHFKTRTVQLYAGWVALYSVCSAYIKHVMLSQPDFYMRLQSMHEGAIETLEKCLSKLKIHNAQTTGHLPNIESAFRLLQPVASKWQNIGTLLGIAQGKFDKS